MKWQMKIIAIVIFSIFHYWSRRVDSIINVNHNLVETDCHPEPFATEQQCLLRGCLWKVSLDIGKPWCYKNSKKFGYKLIGNDDNFVKVDCHPEPGATEQRCVSRGCIWQGSPIADEPWCFFGYGKDKFAGYKLKEVTVNVSTHFEAVLSRFKTPSLYGGDDEEIIFRMVVFRPSGLIIDFRSKNRHLRPVEPLRTYKKRISKLHQKFNRENTAEALLFNVEIQSDPFGIRVKRQNTGEIIFDTFNISGFVHAEQYLSLTSRKSSYYAYGFGENVHKTLDHDFAWRKWGMFSGDAPSGGSVHNLYGVHPFHLALEKNGNAHGIFLINANAQSVQFSPYPSLTYRTIGGVLAFVILAGPTPDQVIQHYTDVIGHPTLPPYWSLGFHLCRFGYKNTDNVKQVFTRNQLAGIPQDVQWLDIDYMEKRKDFTYDKGNFSDLPKLATMLKTKDTKLVLILDPAIMSDTDDDYKPLKDGLKRNVFIMDPRTKKPIKGRVWPGNCYFPDWTNPNTSIWWRDHVQAFYDTIPYDGLWLDMNEPANFVSGSLTGCEVNKWNNPPFVPLQDQDMTTKTLCMDSMQHLGRHYDWHSFYGHLESAATNIALRLLFPKKRPFILSRSTFAGTGFYAFHWTGDNTSEWPDLEWSIIASIEFNMFGMPFVGADICGFNKNSKGQSADEELCTRWMQLGAFYPFSRNHNSDDKTDQDPAVWSQSSIDSSKNVLLIRYKYLPYLYSLLWQSHVKGWTVMRPLFFEFPNDSNTYSISDQFLWGSGLMIAPILKPNTFVRQVYFPESRWYSLLNGSEINLTAKHLVDVPIGMYEIALFVKGGVIIPWQEPAQNTVQSRKNPMGLLVALCERGGAQGFLYWDDGEAPSETGQYSLFNFHVLPTATKGAGALFINATRKEYKDQVKLDIVQIFGLPQKPAKIRLNKVEIASSQIKFNLESKALEVNNLGIDLFDFKITVNSLDWIF